MGFPDLKKWLEKKDREAEVKKHDWKGKRKAPDSPKRKIMTETNQWCRESTRRLNRQGIQRRRRRRRKILSK